MLKGKRILLVVSGGIAAFKVPDLIRRLAERGVSVRCAMTKAAEQFVTPLTLASLSGEKVSTDIFSLTDEAEMGHIELSRDADLVVVAPATANILARMANGLADDMATTLLLATDKPVLVAPAMNVRMWHHPATQRNIAQLKADGVAFIGPNEGEMACGEYGPGRMSEPLEIVAAIEAQFGKPLPKHLTLVQPRSANASVAPLRQDLKGRRAIVTSGPTHEPIDPVRYIANRSSGKQGHAIAAALAARGAEVTLVTGPVSLPDPPGVKTVHVEAARDMFSACFLDLPVDIFVAAAAVADWRVAVEAPQKLKKSGDLPPTLKLAENPDILRAIATTDAKRRPALVVGFAAETENVVAHAQKKLSNKGCDWILANDVSEGTQTFGGDSNAVHLVTANAVEDWPRMSKPEVAARLAERIAAAFSENSSKKNAKKGS
ncbi:bifunctional phosphopantothenoylcysteine decarboxylase/phosphopantothenate--cysteine ligase CoaBC [Ferrovibrio sp.]|uniref:bifunctional phosphopantothenoylcysteine decarboxylase/phosphopantothenate--cysteine ligase CoaBC n=1 Tax=Ferrovibrio sp. TaxID=1917215 RepID=UPI000CB99654|nr:bifunctional phosphopantothenoylcysteine decarboxylase/phosphopantothenate--cysteine ligase CoaBC [Ferrovibrio sp.]PJI37443.1 MAG: bifunctional phosphopantothenoylcysteine decarboxylase/phosphopantothenate--cysteine ligase CoaBC [Ferrovibrio sp.]